MGLETRIPKVLERFCHAEEEERVRAEEEQRIRAEEICTASEKDIGRCALREEEIGAAMEEEEIRFAREKEEIRVDSSVCCLVCQFCLTNGVDSWSLVDCKICAAKAAALERIKMAGGDSIRAAKDSAARAAADVCVINLVHDERNKRNNKPGFGKRRMRVPEHSIQRLLTRHQLKPLRPLPEDYLQKNPHHRELMKNVAGTVLLSIEHDENILFQFFKNGFVDMEVDLA